ncbi:sulfate transport system substrate-binding protein [Amaricoccus macauensis]|uniref:Sulfate transport system substrate-binding protein n=1 Tax=Amaricoccus macauensis TaxID=57001 RepID=A0A840SQN6_9RHOB|nr:thiosulfate ABC transporter substrate-binding protein CysP [Amaricoccus macauensis]MBB5222778.1 sulfate transport system substrate-binding protein [Amaricoccus macauensis]
MRHLRLPAIAFAIGTLLAPPAAHADVDGILNVSYDIARELYAAIDQQFTTDYQTEHGRALKVDQSHAGSSKQARAILEGLQADVVTFNQVTDVEVLAQNGFVAPDWQTKLPNNASPYYSLPAFVVRAGNPKDIRNWGDLARDDVKVVFPNPKTSGNGRYTYLAARAWANHEFGGDEEKVTDYLKKVFANVPVFDTGGRAATTTFAERGIGDVLITFEAELSAIAKQYGPDKVTPVVPPVSLLAEFPVAVVDKVVDARGSRPEAEAYLNYLYTPAAQDIIVSFGNRVNDDAVMAAHADQFPKVELYTVEDEFGGWQKATEEHFSDGGLIDDVFVAQ